MIKDVAENGLSTFTKTKYVKSIAVAPMTGLLCSNEVNPSSEGEHLRQIRTDVSWSGVSSRLGYPPSDHTQREYFNISSGLIHLFTRCTLMHRVKG